MNEISAFGVIHKAPYKAFFPVPPGVNKIPKSKLIFSRSERSYNVDHHAALKHRPDKTIATVSRTKKPDVKTGNQYVAHADTEPGFRRRGVAANTLAQARKEMTVDHSRTRSALGEKFAIGTEKKLGRAKPQASNGAKYYRLKQMKASGVAGRPHKIYAGKEPREPYVTERGVQRNRAYRPQTVSRARRGR